MTTARLQPGTFWSGGKVEVVSIELSGNRCDQGLRPEHIQPALVRPTSRTISRDSLVTTKELSTMWPLPNMLAHTWRTSRKVLGSVFLLPLNSMQNLYFTPKSALL